MSGIHFHGEKMGKDILARLRWETQLGWFEVHWNSQGQLTRVCPLGSQASRKPPQKNWDQEDPWVSSRRAPSYLVRAMHSFEGTLNGNECFLNIENDDLDQTAWTSFQGAVYEFVRRIPFGSSRTYEQVACGIGKPKSARAVGQTLAKNPVLLWIPCHRVLPKKGGIGGFMGSWNAVSLKDRLIRAEQDSVAPPFDFLPKLLEPPAWVVPESKIISGAV